MMIFFLFHLCKLKCDFDKIIIVLIQIFRPTQSRLQLWLTVGNHICCVLNVRPPGRRLQWFTLQSDMKTES